MRKIFILLLIIPLLLSCEGVDNKSSEAIENVTYKVENNLHPDEVVEIKDGERNGFNIIEIPFNDVIKTLESESMPFGIIQEYDPINNKFYFSNISNSAMKGITILDNDGNSKNIKVNTHLFGLDSDLVDGKFIGLYNRLDGEDPRIRRITIDEKDQENTEIIEFPSFEPVSYFYGIYGEISAFALGDDNTQNGIYILPNDSTTLEEVFYSKLVKSNDKDASKNQKLERFINPNIFNNSLSFSVENTDLELISSYCYDLESERLYKFPDKYHDIYGDINSFFFTYRYDKDNSFGNILLKNPDGVFERYNLDGYREVESYRCYRVNENSLLVSTDNFIDFIDIEAKTIYRVTDLMDQNISNGGFSNGVYYFGIPQENSQTGFMDFYKVDLNSIL